MSFPHNVWQQLKGLTAGEVMSALSRDGWTLDCTRGSIHTYIKASPAGNRRVQIHFHGKNKGWQPRLLKGILDDIAWTEADLARLKII